MKNIHSKQKMRKSRAESDTNVVGEKKTPWQSYKQQSRYITMKL